MVIYIDKTIGIQKRALSSEERLLFSDLASSHQHGNCFLCGDIHSLEYLVKFQDGVSKDIYRRILDRHSTSASIIQLVETVLVLTYEEKASVPSFMEGKHLALKIQDAIRNASSFQCALVAENLDDCKFYTLIAERFITDKKIKGIQCSVRKEPGGGDTINNLLIKCVEEDKVLTLCLVDSDIKYGPTQQYRSNPPKGNTAKKLEKTYLSMSQKYIPCTCELYCLKVHEIENLIPTLVLAKITESLVPEMKAGVELICRLVELGLTEAVLYYDFKKGKSRFSSDAEKAYWSEVALIIGDDTFPKMCDHLLDKALSILSKDDFIKYVPVDDYLIEHWENIGRKVFTWGCSNQPIRA